MTTDSPSQQAPTPHPERLKLRTAPNGGVRLSCFHFELKPSGWIQPIPSIRSRALSPLINVQHLRPACGECFSARKIRRDGAPVRLRIVNHHCCEGLETRAQASREIHLFYDESEGSVECQ